MEEIRFSRIFFHTDWVRDLAILASVSDHLNEPNERLQREEKLTAGVLLHVNVFQLKLEFFQRQEFLS